MTGRPSDDSVLHTPPPAPVDPAQLPNPVDLRVVVACGLAAAALLGGGFYLTREATVSRLPVQTLVIARQPAVREILVRGIIEAPGPITILSPQSGTVAQLPVPVGGPVSAGTPLVTLAAQPGQGPAPQRRVRSGDTPATAAPAGEPSPDPGRDLALRAVAAAEKKRAGMAELVAKGFAVPAALKKADEALAEARAAVPPAATAKGSAGGRLRATTDGEVDTVDDEGGEPFQAAIVAPGAGMVASYSVKPGDRLKVGQVVATLTPARPPALSALVGRDYAREVRPGLSARLILDALDAAFPARVETLGSPDPDTGSVPVRIVAAAPIALQDRTPGSSRIVLERQDNAILIPRTALRPGTASTVLLVKRGRTVVQAVTISPWPGPRVLVKAGLSPGDVLVTTPEGLAPGVAVIPR